MRRQPRGLVSRELAVGGGLAVSRFFYGSRIRIPREIFLFFFTDPARNFNQSLGPRLFLTSFPDNLQGYIFLLRLNLNFF